MVTLRRDGSPPYLIIGRVLKPWGYHGEMKIEILTDFPDRFASLRTVYLGDDAKSFSVDRARRHGKAVLLKLVGIDSVEAANTLRDQLVHVARNDAVPLRTNQLYIYQLIGLQVRTSDGELLGTISEVLDTGANDVYVVNAGSHEILIPAIEEVVREINIERSEVVVKLIEGLR